MSRDALNEEERSGPKAWRVKGPRCVEYSFFEGQKDGQRLEGRSDSSGVGDTAGCSLVPGRAAWGLLSTEVVRVPSRSCAMGTRWGQETAGRRHWVGGGGY